MQNYKEAAEYIKSKIGDIKPRVAVVLGSGLGVLSDDITNKITINYRDIPGFPVSTVEGHKGELIIGKIGNTEVVAMNGRIHYYEGYDLKEVTFPIRVISLLGVQELILTNASGGINMNFKAGDFMVITDHISFLTDSTLRGKNDDEFGPRFPDMTEVYNKERSAKLKEIINKYTGRAQEGTYACLKGPTFETPAEIRALRILGVDAVGLSTVPEAVVAKHCGLRTSAVSCVTNMGAGIEDERLSYDDVKKTADKVKENFRNIIKEYIMSI